MRGEEGGVTGEEGGASLQVNYSPYLLSSVLLVLLHHVQLSEDFTNGSN